MSKPMISVAGIRGVVGDSLLPEEFIRYVLAFATIAGGGPVVVGGDTRLSRDMMRHLAFAALESAGCRVLDIGLVPTPTVGLMVRELKAAGVDAARLKLRKPEMVSIFNHHNSCIWNIYPNLYYCR